MKTNGRDLPRKITLSCLVILTIATACQPGAADEPDDGETQLEVFNNGRGKIAFAAQQNKGDAYNIHYINAETRKVYQVTESDFAEIAPSIEPDGNRLVFSSNQLGTYDL